MSWFHFLTKRGTLMAEDALEYITSTEASIAILREIAKIRFRERLWLVMAGVAQCLVEAGVDFSRVDYNKLATVTNDQIDQIYEDLF